MTGNSCVKVQIRPAQADDTAGVLRFWSVARSLAATTEDDRVALLRLAADRPSVLFLAHLDDSLVGTVIAAWDGWRGHLYRLAVLPAHRRQGIGRRLVVCGQERLSELGATRVNAAVGEDDPGPIAFWTAMGYCRDPSISRFARSL